MRKFYTIVTLLFFSMVALKTTAQPIAGFQKSFSLSPFSNDNFKPEENYSSADFRFAESEIDVTGQADVTCRVDFEINQTPNSPLYKKFTAIPWHSEDKKPVYICWKFGDGKDTCIQYSNTFTGPYSVVHFYQQPGSYEVCVRVVYEGGCESKKCEMVVVEKPDECRADFEKLLLSNTISDAYVTFKAIPSHNNGKKPKLICWKFGDGKDTCIQYSEDYAGAYLAKHHYRENGEYEVCVTISYYGGCTATKCEKVQIGRRDECKVDFELIPVTTTNTLLDVYYKAEIGHTNNKKPVQICWKFGDGRDTCIQYPENYTGNYAVRHQYKEAGKYEVCIKVIFYGGCEAYQCKPILIGRTDECKADFERVPLVSTTSPLAVYYAALPTHSNNKKPREICWTFGDGKDTCIQYPENFTGTYIVKHQYREPGKYEVCVKINYYGGCSAYECKSVLVGRPDECKVDFERLPITSTNDPHHVAFKALTSHNNDKKPKTICWSFGDGKDTCIQYPENYAGDYIIKHDYREPGSYEVCIKILYYGGCEAKKCETIRIESRSECKVNLFEITPSINSLVRGFKASPWSSGNKKPLRICWYFGDGTDTCIEINQSTNLDQLGIRHTYPAPGNYKACVKVLFDGGCIATECVEVIIRSSTNSCGGYMTDSLASSKTVKFKGYSVHNANDPVVGYYWSFGDGSSASGPEATHTYNQAGSYEVCLTIKTQLGCETRICKKLNVPGNSQPVLSISPNPVTTVMNLLFYSTHTEPVTIRIVNSFGVILKVYTKNASTGANNWSLDLSTLVAGSYTLYIQSPNQLSSQLFIKN